MNIKIYWQNSISNHPGWWLRFGNQSQQDSILASSMDPKRIQTPHTLFRDFWIKFWADKTFQPLLIGQAAEFKFEPNSKEFKHLKIIEQSLPVSIPGGNQMFWLPNQWQSCWGSAQAQLGWAGFPSWQQLLRAATGLLSEKVLPLLWNSHFRWLHALQKRLKWTLAWFTTLFMIILNWFQQPNCSQMKSYAWKPCIDLHWQDSFDFLFKDFLSNLLLKINIYCVADQKSITWS